VTRLSISRSSSGMSFRAIDLIRTSFPTIRASFSLAEFW
jgi:hypothetical protein